MREYAKISPQFWIGNTGQLAEFSEFGPNFKIHRKITYFENLPVEVSV